MAQFYQGVFDNAGVADGDPMFVSLLATDVPPRANAEGSFSEKVTIHRIFVDVKDAPAGASLRIRVRDGTTTIAKFVDTFILPAGTTSFVLRVSTDNRRMPASPKTLQFTVFNSDGVDGRDPAADFKAWFGLEVDRDTIL